MQLYHLSPEGEGQGEGDSLAVDDTGETEERA